MKNSLLFIPDISGFTSFVNETEITHSRHIISDLLELIIDADDLNLQVSEVEGDAILFYKYEKVPTFNEIYEQVIKTFSLFHQFIQQYEHERICRCGACSTAMNLSLKFVVHVGEVEQIKIKNHNKLHGKSVILAHRLLKNNVGQNEYLLWTKDSFQAIEPVGKEKVESQSIVYDSIGEVQYNYISLSKELHEQKKKISLPLHDENNRISLSREYNLDISFLYEMVTDFEKRLNWDKRVSDIITANDQALLKSGDYHTCVIGDNKLNIQSIGRVEDNGKIIYAERLNDFKFFKALMIYFVFEEKNGKTKLTIENSFKLKYRLLNFAKSIVKRQLMKTIDVTHQELKALE